MQWKTGAAKILPPKPTRFSHVRSNIPQIVRESNPAHNRIAYYSTKKTEIYEKLWIISSHIISANSFYTLTVEVSLLYRQNIFLKTEEISD